MDLETASTAWGFAPQAYLCQRCDARFWLRSDAPAPAACPRCHAPALESADPGAMPLIAAPELVRPFAVSAPAAAAQATTFANSFPYPPADLKPQAVQSRLQAMFLPVWLVDVNACAEWKAEAGFYYDVVSHQERYDGGGWRTNQVTEQRTRWEPRLGKLERAYPNRPAPALEDHPALAPLLGEISPAAAAPYSPALVGAAAVRLPDRGPADAWPDVLPPLQQLAADDCRRACQADQIRAFAWTPTFPDPNWTLMLLPVYTSFYTDDDNRAQPIWIDGQSGRITGVRRASMQAAQRTALILLGIGVAIFILSVALALAGMVFPPALVIGPIGMAVGAVVGVCAIVPLFRVWQFNKG